jgi:hypothetical protein
MLPDIALLGGNMFTKIGAWIDQEYAIDNLMIHQLLQLNFFIWVGLV